MATFCLFQLLKFDIVCWSNQSILKQQNNYLTNCKQFKTSTVLSTSILNTVYHVKNKWYWLLLDPCQWQHSVLLCDPTLAHSKSLCGESVGDLIIRHMSLWFVCFRAKQPACYNTTVIFPFCFKSSSTVCRSNASLKRAHTHCYKSRDVCKSESSD